MRTYWNTTNGLRTIKEWQPGCWVQVTCPTEEDKNFLEETLKIPDYYVSDIADTDERARQSPSPSPTWASRPSPPFPTR